MNTTNVKVSFFHGRTVDGHRFTIAGVIENGVIDMGIAICGIGDLFCKARGRAIASGRVLNQRTNSGGGKLSKDLEVHMGIEREVFNAEAAKYNTYTRKKLMSEFGLLKK